MKHRQAHPTTQQVSAHNENDASGLRAGSIVETPMLTQIAAVSEADEIRAYILSMVIELAEMADNIDDPQLADSLRYVGWPAEPPGLLRRQR
jgi:hypothetical protein